LYQCEALSCVEKAHMKTWLVECLLARVWIAQPSHAGRQFVLHVS